MRKCLFCDSPANDREHLFAAWLIKTLEVEMRFRRKIGKNPDQWITDENPRIKCVCKACKQGWMSDLETASKPFVGELARGGNALLTGIAQETIAQWAVKTSMVFESLTAKDRDIFYLPSQCQDLRKSLSVPLGTNVWIGRSAVSSLGAWGMDRWDSLNDVTKALRIYVTTFAAGNLIIQVLSSRGNPQFSGPVRINFHEGPWGESLIPIWPVILAPPWPPPLSFSVEGQLPLSMLLNRFKVGIRL